jgi:hypothetical protein
MNAQAADGSVHVFPDGTDPSVVDKVMKDYATKGSGTPDPAPPAPERTGFLGAAGSRLMDTVYGTGQLIEHLNPFTSAEHTARVDENLRKRADELRRERSAPPASVSDTTLDSQGRATHTRQPAERGNPSATLGELGGEVLNPLNYLAPEWDAAKLAWRGLTGAGQGALSAATQPATNKGYWSEKTAQIGTGTVAGGAIPYIEQGAISAGKLAKTLWDWSLGRGYYAPSNATQRAIDRLAKRYEQDRRGGGPTAQDMIDLRNTAPGKPWSLGDVGGENMLNLIGRVQRQPGAARQTITKFLDERDLGAGDRLNKDVEAALGDKSEYQLFEGLKQARSQSAKPLFEAAYAGGSIAPLRDQLAKQFDEAQTAIDRAADAISAAARDPAKSNQVPALRDQLQQAIRDRDAIRKMSQQAENDAASNAPGAIWSPRLQQFLDNPRLQQGLRKGMQIERDTALAEGRAVNNSEYAITGTDPTTGEDIIGKVPTMRLLAVAKEGLDRMLQSPEFKNPLTGELNKEGVALDRMRGAYLDELDRLNPLYKTARDQWGGDTQSMAALKFGEEFASKMKPEEITERMKNYTPNDREFARIGLAARLRREVATTGAQGNEARSLARNKLVQEQYRPFFDSDAEFDTFIKSLKAEDLFFQRRGAIKSGSITAARVAEDQSKLDAGDLGHAAMAAMATMHNNPALLAYHAGKTKWVRDKLGLSEPGKVPEDVAAEIGNIVADPQRSLQVMGRLQAPPPVTAGRSLARRLAEKGASGVAAQHTAADLGLQ